MPQEDDLLRARLEAAIAGRTVSVVGNASSILKGRHGERIDSGCVLRMNAGIPVSARAQGKRVDIHCFGTRPNVEENIRRRRRYWLMRRKADFFDRALSIWMTLLERERCDDPDQLFYPAAMAERLANALGARPSVGISALDMLSRLTAANVNIFGFDFKETTTFYRKQENRGPHDWAAERRYALALIETKGWKLFE